MVAGAKLFDRYRCRFAVALGLNRQRQKRAEGAVEGDAVEGLLLEEPADEQEEHEAGERIHEPLAASGGDVDEAAAEEHREPEGERDFERHDAAFARRARRRGSSRRR